MAPTPSTTRREGVSIILLILLFILWPGGESACNGHLNVLRERRAAVCSVPSETVLPANESKLVHMTSEFRAQPGALTDPEFGVSAEGFALVRTCTSLGTN